MATVSHAGSVAGGQAVITCPYKPQVILDVSFELWRRSLDTMSPRLLTDDAGVLLDKITDLGLVLPTQDESRIQLDSVVARWSTQVALHKVGHRPCVQNDIYDTLFAFAFYGSQMDLSIRYREDLEPALWEQYRWLLGLKPNRYVGSSDRLLILIHTHNL